MSQEWCRGEGTQSTQNRCKIWVQLGCNNTSRELLWALKQAIGAVDFQSVTSETSAVTAEAAGSSPVVLRSGSNLVQLGQCFSLVEHHPNKFALCQPFVRHTRLSVKVQRNATVRMT